MTKQLTPIDVLALGFMTFALFLGAGNVIFPPGAGLAAGENIWPTAFGFLITAVGLPLLTLIALARAVVCYAADCCRLLSDRCGAFCPGWLAGLARLFDRVLLGRHLSGSEAGSTG